MTRRMEEYVAVCINISLYPHAFLTAPPVFFKLTAVNIDCERWACPILLSVDQKGKKSCNFFRWEETSKVSVQAGLAGCCVWEWEMWFFSKCDDFYLLLYPFRVSHIYGKELYTMVLNPSCIYRTDWLEWVSGLEQEKCSGRVVYYSVSYYSV